MKTYPVLDIPIPTIAYCILHQPRKGKPADEYAGTMKALHQRVQKESEEIRNAYAKGVREVVARDAQQVAGLLSQYLTTPIKSDQAEVKRIITEGVEQSLKQTGAVTELGVVWSSEGKASFPPFRKAFERKLQQNGKAYLQELGFATDGSAGDVHESVFLVEGGVNLDLLEHVVRDRIGIYRAPHGTHLEESAAFTFSAYNLVYELGARPPQERKQGLVEVAMYFSKPAVEYEEFRRSLTSGLEQHFSGDAVLHTSLWQRKLGLGKGREFILRCLCDEVKRLDGIVQWLHEENTPDILSEAMAEKGAMVLKELLF